VCGLQVFDDIDIHFLEAKPPQLVRQRHIRIGNCGGGNVASLLATIEPFRQKIGEAFV